MDEYKHQESELKYKYKESGYSGAQKEDLNIIFL
jgi:hypothetical protein